MNFGQWRGLVIACRPPQWMKNLVVFATAVLRYALMVSKGEGETPEEAVLADVVLGVAAVAWGVIFVVGVGL